MKKIFLSLALLLSAVPYQISAMQDGPMNANWFYAESNPYKAANRLYQNREWAKAAAKYKKLLINNVGSEYDREMARLNLSSCLMAQRVATSNWASFDTLSGIAADKQLSRKTLKATGSNQSVLIKTDKVGIGDIFHFLHAAGKLKQDTNFDVTLSVRNFLKATLASVAQSYGVNLIGDKDEQPDTTFVTHLIGLLGHLKMKPSAMAPDQVLFTVPDRALNVVRDLVDPALAQNKRIAVVFLGENRQATLIGGKQLPHDASRHGRQLDSKSFQTLLNNHQDLILLDCGTVNGRVNLTEEQLNDRIMLIPAEEQPFDTIIALGRVMSNSKTKGKIVGFGADNGPTNVFSRSLDFDAQNEMAFIIPNGEEYDMRMEGEGSKYKQMISNCWIYKCRTPEDQERVVEKAFKDMAK